MIIDDFFLFSLYVVMCSGYTRASLTHALFEEHRFRAPQFRFTKRRTAFAQVVLSWYKYIYV